MRNKPIIMSAPMVRALLDGTKTQTRRVMKPQPIGDMPICEDDLPCPYAPSMYLWVRETWQIFERFADCVTIRYRASEGRSHTEFEERRVVALPRDYNTSIWRPSIHMPRWASRLTLEVTDVRAERVQDINDTDIRSEGFGLDGDAVAWGADLRGEFSNLWDALHGEQYQWNANPWVWAIAFAVHRCNVDNLVGEAA